MGDIDDAVAELDALTAEVERLADEPTGGALVPAGVDAAVLKRSMAERRALVVRRRAEVEAKVTEIQEMLAGRLQAAEQVVGPLQAMVKRLEEGIWTVNLYLGRDEQIVQLRDGAPAGEGTPVVARQMVLSMAEETAIAADEGGIDARNVDEFDAWLLADVTHLTQVLPEAKGVVVLQPRARSDRRDYRDPWMQDQMDEANARSYWLIRNGERLYRMATNFEVGERMVPTRDEFTAFFERDEWVDDFAVGDPGWKPGMTRQHRERRPLAPGSQAWLDAEEKADAKQRHYMRVALILQGLADRTTVFHPIPAGLSFLDPRSYDAGHVQIITDSEQSIGTGRPAFYDWQRALCAQLRPGMRIVGAFGRYQDSGFGAHNEKGRNYRLHPDTAERPASGVVYRLEAADGSYLKFLYDRADKRYGYEHGDWGQWGEWPYKQRASCRVSRDDRWIIPIDLVDPADLRWYLDARQDRHAYADLFPLLKSALTAIEAETASEAPFRLLLAGEVAKANGVSVEAAESVLDGLIRWWKLKNRWHRPLLNPEPEIQARAIADIVAEDARRRTADPDRDAAAVKTLRHAVPAAVFVAAKPDGTWVAVEPADGRLIYAHLHVLRRSGKIVTTEWVLPSTFGRWKPLWQSPEWVKWDHGAKRSEHLTGPEREAFAALLAGQDVKPVAVTYPDGQYPYFVVWMAELTESDDDFFHQRSGMPALQTRRVPWRRERDGKIVTDLSDRGNYSFTRTWSYRDAVPWNGRHDEVVWVDEPLLAAVKAQHAVLTAAYEADQQLNDEARDFARLVDKAWDVREEARLYARFLEDYADPDLWDGHRKTLRINAPREVFDKALPIGRLLAERKILVPSGLTYDALARMVDTEVDPDLADLVIITATSEPEEDDDE